MNGGVWDSLFLFAGWEGRRRRRKRSKFWEAKNRPCCCVRQRLFRAVGWFDMLIPCNLAYNSTIVQQYFVRATSSPSSRIRSPLKLHLLLILELLCVHNSFRNCSTKDWYLKATKFCLQLTRGSPGSYFLRSSTWVQRVDIEIQACVNGIETAIYVFELCHAMYTLPYHAAL